MEISVNDLKDKYSNNIDLTLLENKIIDGNKLTPLGKGYSFNTFLCDNLNKFDSTYNENDLIHLDDNNIYFVVEHQYFNFFYHEMNELVFLIQFYINELKNNRINNKNIKVISKKRIYDSDLMKSIKSCFDDSDFTYTDNNKYYKGSFLYYNFFIGKRLIENHIFINNYFSIIENLKNNAYQKYKHYPFYDKIWISRRNLNIKTYWHKRFNTSIIKNSKIRKVIKNNGFSEIYFPPIPPLKKKRLSDTNSLSLTSRNEADFLYQVYLMMNVKIVFAEIGASCCNMYFMNKGIWISDYDSTNLMYNNILKCIGVINNILVKVYPTIIDTESIYYNLISCSHNQPYKFEDDDKFIEWFKDSHDSQLYHHGANQCDTKAVPKKVVAKAVSKKVVAKAVSKKVVATAVPKAVPKKVVAKAVPKKVVAKAVPKAVPKKVVAKAVPKKVVVKAVLPKKALANPQKKRIGL
jgi:hypothetical protein